MGFYPPLAKAFFLVLARIYSHNTVSLAETIRNSPTDPRMFQSGLAIFLLFILMVSLVIVVLVSAQFKDDNGSALIGASVIGTYSVLWAIERGNVIYLAFMFLLVYVLYYQSENRLVREMALISLALAAGLKLYPAAFGVLLLFERRWKESIRAVLYGITSVVVPYVLTKRYIPESAGETAGNILTWAKGLLSGLMELDGFVRILLVAAVMISFIAMVIVGRKCERKWIKVMFAGFLAMTCGLQFTYIYSYTFLLPALVLFFVEEQEFNWRNLLRFFFLCMIHLPLPIFGMVQTLPLVGEIKLYALLVFMIWLSVQEVKSVLKG